MEKKMKVTKRATVTLEMNERGDDKASLNIKISHELNDNLKLARAIARTKNMKFNVSNQVEEHLTYILKVLEESLEVDFSDYELVNNKAVLKSDKKAITVSVKKDK